MTWAVCWVWVGRCNLVTCMMMLRPHRRRFARHRPSSNATPQRWRDAHPHRARRCSHRCSHHRSRTTMPPPSAASPNQGRLPRPRSHPSPKPHAPRHPTRRPLRPRKSRSASVPRRPTGGAKALPIRPPPLPLRRRRATATSRHGVPRSRWSRSAGAGSSVPATRSRPTPRCRRGWHGSMRRPPAAGVPCRRAPRRLLRPPLRRARLPVQADELIAKIKKFD